jgi:hypothetical protein
MAKTSLFQWGLFQRAPLFQTYPPEVETAVLFDGDAGPGAGFFLPHHELLLLEDQTLIELLPIMMGVIANARTRNVP